MPGPYPLATLAPTITAAGITAPPANDILQSLIASIQGIYGSDTYLGSDSQDGQIIGIFSDAMNDANNGIVVGYYNHSPNYAQGAALSAVVKINGVERTVPTNSSCPANIFGVFGTLITNGMAQDQLGNLWNLPTSVLIPASGEIEVTITAQAPGAINAEIGTINIIATPTQGWQGLTNIARATVGQPVQTDASLRRNQAQATNSPGEDTLGNIIGAVSKVPGVSEVTGYENNTDTVDINGMGAHSFGIVALGGTLQNIVNAIGLAKPPGIQTNGNAFGVYVDPRGISKQIFYFILSQIPITTVVTIRAFGGYSSTTNSLIQEAIAAYLSNLAIGEYSYNSRAVAAAGLKGDDATNATGMTQQQLDALSNTYNVISVAQSRTPNIADTHVIGGPYFPGLFNFFNVNNTGDMYPGQIIGITLDDASVWEANIVSIGGSEVVFEPEINIARNIPSGAAIYLLSDIRIAFDEQAIALPANVSVVLA